MFALLLNFLLFFFTSIIFWKKDKRMSLRFVVMLFYTITAFASYYCMLIDALEQYVIYRNDDNSIIPFLLNYLCILSLSLLLSGYEKCIDSGTIQAFVKNRFFRSAEIIIVVINIIYIIMMYFYAQILLEIGFEEVYEMIHEDTVIFTFDNSIMNVLFYRSKDIIRFVFPYFLLLQFSKLSLGYEKTRSIILILSLVIPELVYCILLSNRGGMVFCLANVLFFLIVFWDRFGKPLKRKIIGAGVVILSFSIFYMFLITLARSDDDVDKAKDTYILGYFAQTYCNLGWEVWDADGKFIGGARKFPGLLKMLGLYKEPALEGLLTINYYYEEESGFPITLFKSFWGDLYCEFGVFLSLFVVFLYFLLFASMKRVLKSSIFLLIVLYNHYTLLFHGLFNANLTENYLISLFITYLVCCILKNKYKYGKQY